MFLSIVSKYKEQDPITVPIYNSRIKICRNSLCDPRGHLRFVEKYKQNCESLCLGSITMCMPNFVKIRRVISKRRTEMWFIGSNFVDSWHFNKKPQFLTLRKNRKINPRLVSRHKKHVHANFCRNQMSAIQDI